MYWTKTKKVGEKACLTLTLPQSITWTDEFLIYSMKGTADIKEQLLAYMFKLCIATVRRNTITWANYLCIVFILTSYLEKQGKSQARHVPEILGVPMSGSCWTAQRSPWRQPLPWPYSDEHSLIYKNRTTLKWLIVVSLANNHMGKGERL